MSIPTFEGKEVSKVTARIVGAGDGLSDPLDVEPVIHHLGDEAWIVLKATTTQLNHKPASRSDSEPLQRVQTYSAVEAVFVDEADVEHLLAAQREKVAAAKAEREEAEQARLEEEERAALEAEQREAGILSFDDAADPDGGEERAEVPAAADDVVKDAKAKRAAAGDD